MLVMFGNKYSICIEGAVEGELMRQIFSNI